MSLLPSDVNVSRVDSQAGDRRDSHTDQTKFGGSRYVPPHLRGQAVKPTLSVAPVASKQTAQPAEKPKEHIERIVPLAHSAAAPAASRWSENSDRFASRDVRAGNFQSNSTQSSNDVRFSNLNRGAPRGQRRTGERDEALERELFGDVATKPKGIDFKNYEDIPVETSGLDVPEPIEHFTDMQDNEILVSNIGLSGYDRPTPVQRHSIPIAMSGRDLMSCAQTGSGKTAAFLLPMIATILKHELHTRAPPSNYGRQRRAFPSALVLAPTRELATQIYNECRKFVYRTGLQPVVVYGGADIRNQLRDVERGCDILVATPGRLVDFLDRGRISLAHIEFLVFDEADRMLDMGFEPQIRAIVSENDMPQDTRQTLMFSATFPKEIQRLAQDFLRNYVFLAVGRVGSTTEYITQKVEYAAQYESEKIDRLMSILAGCEGLTLIFVETKRGADALEHALQREGIDATSIHGDRTQGEREHALAMFRCGRCPVLVATDVASRGLDIPQVRCVVNYDLPSNIDDYVHRIGRTGRAGQKGTAVAFVAEKNRPILKDLYDLLKENNQEIPGWFDTMLNSGGFGGGSSSWGGGRGRGGGSRSGGGGGRGGGRGGFASRDYRQDMGGAPPRQTSGQQAPPAASQRFAPAQSYSSRGRGGGYSDAW